MIYPSLIRINPNDVPQGVKPIVSSEFFQDAVSELFSHLFDEQDIPEQKEFYFVEGETGFEIYDERNSWAPVFEVKTPAGSIKVIPSYDPDYPGVYVDINDEQAVLVEYQVNNEYHKIHLWREEDHSDDSFMIYTWDE